MSRSNATSVLKEAPAAPLRQSELAAKRRIWDEAPLELKVAALVFLAATGGMLLGVAQRYFELQVWVMLGLWTSWLVALRWMGRRWVMRPIERLLKCIQLVSSEGHREALRKLPVTRGDEVGQMARAVHRLAMMAIHHRLQARALRRTLDRRIVRATQQATRQLRQLAMRDALTDLGNRRFLETHLEPLVTSIREADEDLLCIMIDVDNFKEVNDTHGHAAGDELLVLLASLIRACVRHEDMAVRLGGDEFVVFLPTATLQRGQQLAESLRRMFRQQSRTVYRQDPLPDLSVGVASLRAEGCETGQMLLERADKHLYRAKRAGKGQVCLSNAENFTPLMSNPVLSQA